MVAVRSVGDNNNVIDREYNETVRIWYILKHVEDLKTYEGNIKIN